MRDHERHKLQLHPVSPIRPQFRQSFYAIEARILVHIHMTSDSCGATAETTLNGSGRPLENVVRRGLPRIFRKSVARALQRAGWVGCETQYAGLVEMLVHVHQTRRSDAACRIDKLHVAFRLDVGRNIQDDALLRNQHVGLSDIAGADNNQSSPDKAAARRVGLLEQIIHREPHYLNGAEKVKRAAPQACIPQPL